MKLIPNKKYNPENADETKEAPMNVKLKMGDKFLTEMAASTTILVHYKLATGDEEFHVVRVKNKMFKLYNMSYFVDTRYLTYNRTFKLFMATYHETLSLPLKQIIGVQDKLKLPLKQVVNVKGIKDGINNDPTYALVKSNADPSILTEYAKTKVIQDTLNGHALSTSIMKIIIIGVIGLVLMLINLIVSLQASGIFAK